MVGNPKNLSDLRRIEAALRVTCARCGRTGLYDRETLLADRMTHQLPTDWESMKTGFQCECGARDSHLLPVPFADNVPELRRRRNENVLINLALQILRDAAYRSSSQAVGTVEVRLALRVLSPFVRDQNTLIEFWRSATEEPRHPWTSCTALTTGSSSGCSIGAIR